MKILVLNAGSSSQKSCLYQIDNSIPDAPPDPLWEAKVDWTRHHGVAEIKITTDRGVLEEEIPTNSRPDVISHILGTLSEGKTKVINNLAEIDIVGHRVVHGGEEYRQATAIAPQVKDAIIHLSDFAPIHNPANLEGIEAIEKILPDVPQVAVFDTAFHRNIPLYAAIYPIPYHWFESGIRRYGFHGISHSYCAQRTANLLQQDLQSLRLITCHLGNGCSLAAIREGRSVDTTMGFTPLEGLMMGSRSGSIDPSILIYLLQQGYDRDKLDEMLNRESGLKGISGLSADMRNIQSAIASGNSRAQLAFDVYVHSLRKHVGAMLAVLGGVDALVFTGGVGENQPELRKLVCESLGFLGLKLDLNLNSQSPPDKDIATSDSSVRVLIVHTQEDWAIATSCWKLAQT